jgi:hypothetical protein
VDERMRICDVHYFFSGRPRASFFIRLSLAV